MPLIKGKSKKAFEHNLKAEVHAGKPMKQALAIAYNTKRHASRKHAAHGYPTPIDKHYAHGGKVDLHKNHENINKKLHPGHGEDLGVERIERHENEEMHPMHREMIKHIMEKRRHMMKGGMVDRQEHGDHEGVEMDDALESSYSDSDMHNQAFLSHDEEQEPFPDVEYDMEEGNEDQDEARREGRDMSHKKRVMRRIAALMGHGKEEDEGVF